jgi:hypothetical protein
MSSSRKPTIRDFLRHRKVDPLSSPMYIPRPTIVVLNLLDLLVNLGIEAADYDRDRFKRFTVSSIARHHRQYFDKWVFKRPEDKSWIRRMWEWLA